MGSFRTGSRSTKSGKRFVSYAQNFEDVILWRALRHVSAGSYIDIGAQDPLIDSVSLAFYEHGWRGVNVEPNGSYAERLRIARPDERVIEAAVGTTVGAIEFFEVVDTGLSTGDGALAEQYRTQGLSVKRTTVPCIRLSDIFEEVAKEELHWLKIDVEGMEQQVISSWQPSSVRPWIVVVESTWPLTAEPHFCSWEVSLIRIGYEFVYFDGLNRFYVSADHPELKEHFGCGPNVFDDFTLSGLGSAPFCRGLLEQAEARQREAQLRVEQAEARQHEAQLRVEQIYASRSWRLTWPLRAVTGIMRRTRDGRPAWLTLRRAIRLRWIVWPCLNGVAVWVRAAPRRHALAVRILQRAPWLHIKLRASLRRLRAEMPHPDPPNAKARGVVAGCKARRTKAQLSQIKTKSETLDMPLAAAKLYEQLLRARLKGSEPGETR